MAKEFLFDETAGTEPLSTSATTVPTATATTSAAHIAPSLITATSTNGKLPRVIGFDISSLPPLKYAEEKSDKIEPSQQAEISIEPSAPSITEFVSCNTSITVSERSTIIEALQKAKLAVCYSKSTDAEIQELSAALEEIYSVTVAASSRMSQKQAEQISEEILKILTIRSKIKEKEIRFTRIANKTNLFDYKDIFLIFLIILRLALDTPCVFFLFMENLPPEFPSMASFTLGVSIINSILTCFMLNNYYCNGYGKLNTISTVKEIKKSFYILWTTFYGIFITLVLMFAFGNNVGICAFISMVIFYIQQCLWTFREKLYRNSNKDSRSNFNAHEYFAMMEAGNNLSLYSPTDTIIDNGVESTNYENNPLNENNDSELRISTVENLKTKIQRVLIVLLGNGYMHHERPVSVNNADKIENKIPNMNIPQNPQWNV